MAIFFRCVCGQDLRAPEELAGGTKDCPACCRRVPVPSLIEANAGVGLVPELELPARAETPLLAPAACAAMPDPESPQQPHGPAWPGASQPPVYQLAPEAGVNLDLVEDCLQRQETRWRFAQARIELDDRQAAGWPAETNWLQCLLYPLRAWPILLGLALAGATLTTLVIAVLPPEWEWAALWPRLPLLLAMLLLAAYTCALYRCVLDSATAGEIGLIRWPGADVPMILWSGSACGVCFLAGPVVPAVIALWFWLQSGDLEWVDELILLELGLVAVGTWMLAFLTVDRSGRLRDANPVAVSRLAWQLGWRGWLTVGLATAGVVMHFWAAITGLEELHRSPLGWFLLVLLGFCGPAWMLFLLRWFGLSQFHARHQRSKRSLPDARPSPAARSRVETPDDKTRAGVWIEN